MQRAAARFVFSPFYGPRECFTSRFSFECARASPHDARVTCKACGRAAHAWSTILGVNAAYAQRMRDMLLLTCQGTPFVVLLKRRSHDSESRCEQKPSSAEPSTFELHEFDTCARMPNNCNSQFDQILRTVCRISTQPCHLCPFYDDDVIYTPRESPRPRARLISSESPR